MFTKIIIEAGHGMANGKTDPGAIAADNTSERSIVVAVAKRLAACFPAARVATVGVFDALTLEEKITRINDICRMERLRKENVFLISLHCDWRGAPDGISGYYKSEDDTAKTALAAILSVLAKDTKQGILAMRGDKESRFKRLGIVRDTIPLACLVEIGTLRIDGDESDGLEYLVKPENQDAIAQSLARGIEQVTGIKAIDAEVSEFAAPSVKKAIAKGVATDWKNPKEIVASPTAELMLYRAGVLNEATGKGITKERFAVVLDRLDLLEFSVG